MPLATFLSGSNDQEKDYVYLKDLLKEPPIRSHIYQHIEQLLNSGYITLFVEQDDRIITIPSDEQAYGGMFLDNTVHTKFNKPIIYRDLPHVTAIGRANNPTETYPIEMVKVRFEPACYYKTLYLYYGRYRPANVDIYITSQIRQEEVPDYDLDVEQMTIEDPK